MTYVTDSWCRLPPPPIIRWAGASRNDNVNEVRIEFQEMREIKTENVGVSAVLRVHRASNSRSIAFFFFLNRLIEGLVDDASRV